jgi:hypothetical protein
MIYFKINTMTPQEKAEELVNKFIKPTIKWNPVNGIGYYNDLNAAKECALIAVDEIIANIEPSVSMDVIEARINYWQEVKQEIENI